LDLSLATIEDRSSGDLTGKIFGSTARDNLEISNAWNVVNNCDFTTGYWVQTIHLTSQLLLHPLPCATSSRRISGMLMPPPLPMLDDLTWAARCVSR